MKSKLKGGPCKGREFEVPGGEYSVRHWWEAGSGEYAFIIRREINEGLGCSTSFGVLAGVILSSPGDIVGTLILKHIEKTTAAGHW